MSLIGASEGFKILDQMGINTNDQRIYKVVLTIEMDEAVKVVIYRYVDNQQFPGDFERKSYVLTEVLK